MEELAIRKIIEKLLATVPPNERPPESNIELAIAAIIRATAHEDNPLFRFD